MTENRLKIKQLLWENTLSHAWLINRLEGRGVDTSNSEFSSILSGTQKGPKTEKVLTVSLEVLNDYQENFGGNYARACCE